MNAVKDFHAVVRAFETYATEKNTALGTLLKGDSYKVLDGFAGWLDQKGHRPGTIRDYVSFVKRLYTHHGISVTTDQVREKVSLPKKSIFQDSPLEPETARRTILVANGALKISKKALKG